ncbi:cAMP-binding domain of CRP or a regulatory subunit of cAMP-dependent protein kinases [Chitinophaga jiangningensis]|uniref:cAMP-binding domain of CRP or a regulatory subunit of cAMP-dependent protein kinases n=1 Tax=Chitinophaga jiangningensis TaxID=1419482 RepID=A0A1M7C2Z6_9BACT|nr:response regulator [Chitinophaga jiangningensis]SHL61219.1 cAMP-binding domain of CRP or a regulatory subunit of cAMP-dependent protein kinases [Chitinophaga jiangningensis]
MAKKTILLIEDNREIRENTAEILTLAGYHVLAAENGKVGVEMALQFSPDLVVCDIMMQVLDGYGVLHMLQKNEVTQDIPFIFLTARTERADIRKGMEMGADDYITKPFSGTDLLHAIESRIKKSDLRTQHFHTNLHGFSRLMEAATGKSPLQELADGRNTEKFRSKQIIYQEGNHVINIFYVQKGKVKTFKRNDDGKELVTDLYNEGDFFGYVPLLENTVYRDTAQAIEDTEIAMIPRAEFEELLSNNREVTGQLMRLLAGSVTAKEQQLLGLAYNSLRRKVAEALLFLNRKYNQRKEVPFSIGISRDNLATIAGTATESVIRTLADFREEKLIEIREGSIVLLNVERLSNMLY